MKEDKRIIEGCLAGKRGAFEELLEKYKSKVYSICIRMVRNPTDAEDIAQEVFVRVFSALDRYDPSFPFSSWLYRITSNMCIDFIRKTKDRPVSIDKPLSGDDGEYAFQLPSDGAGPDRNVQAREMISILEEALARLPERYRMIVILRHEEQLSYEEISESLGIPIGTVKARIHRARNMIKEFFAKKGLIEDLLEMGDE
ncbi:hypothetical protein DRQ05_03525 [bacterium]|nr:MAG: hypothetical protein DRQ05_03525 [bacterium]